MNEETLEQVNKLIETYGLSGAVIVIMIVLLISLFKSKAFLDLTVKFFTKLIDNNFRKGNKKNKPSPKVIEVRESDIVNHEIFNHIDFWLYSHLPTIEFSSNFRTIVFRKYLHVYYKAYKDILHVFVNSGNYKEMDSPELRQAFMKLITDTIFKYESEMAIMGIPPVIIQKMKIKNKDTLNLTLDLINSICDSSFYNSENNLLKVFSLLNIILSILENVISNSQEVCDSINGEMKGLSMDGFTEGED